MSVGVVLFISGFISVYIKACMSVLVVLILSDKHSISLSEKYF